MSEKNKDMFLLAHTFRKTFGNFMSSHSPIGKPEHSLTDAFAPYAFEELRKVYDYFEIFNTSRKVIDSMSDDERHEFYKRFKTRKNYLERLFDEYSKSNSSSIDSFCKMKLKNVLLKIEALYGKYYRYDDTQSYDGKFVDYDFINSFVSQLIRFNKELDASCRYRFLLALSRDGDHYDYDLLQKYINIWKSDVEELDRQLVLLKIGYSFSTVSYVKQQFDYRLFKRS